MSHCKCPPKDFLSFLGRVLTRASPATQSCAQLLPSRQEGELKMASAFQKNRKPAVSFSLPADSLDSAEFLIKSQDLLP